MNQKERDRLRQEAEERNQRDLAVCKEALGKFCRALHVEEAKTDYHLGGVFVEAVFVREMPSGAEVYEYRLMQYQQRATPGGGTQVLPNTIVGSHADTYPVHKFVELVEAWILMFWNIDGAAQLSGHKFRLTNEGWKWVPFGSEET